MEIIGKIKVFQRKCQTVLRGCWGARCLWGVGLGDVEALVASERNPVMTHFAYFLTPKHLAYIQEIFRRHCGFYVYFLLFSKIFGIFEIVTTFMLLWFLRCICENTMEKCRFFNTVWHFLWKTFIFPIISNYFQLFPIFLRVFQFSNVFEGLG